MSLWCRMGWHKWRRRMVQPHPQFIEDGLRLGLPVGVGWVDYCARGCDVSVEREKVAR